MSVGGERARHQIWCYGASPSSNAHVTAALKLKIFPAGDEDSPDVVVCACSSLFLQYLVQFVGNFDIYDNDDDDDDDDDGDDDGDDSDDNNPYAAEGCGGSEFSPALQMSHHSPVHRFYQDDDDDNDGDDEGDIGCGVILLSFFLLLLAMYAPKFNN